MNPSSTFWAGKRVLVTGHTGFKGGWLTLWLAALGARVHGYALPPDAAPNLFDLAAHAHAETTFGDVRDLGTLKACLAASRPEIVIHMAAQALVRASYVDPVGTYATNVMGTVHLLEAVRATPSVQAVVIVTSDKCYENREWPWGYRENEPMGGHDPYSNSKGCAELVTASYRASFFGPESGAEGGVACRIGSARAGNVIGGGDWSADRLIPDAVRAFAAGEAVEIRSPHAIRPWQHVLEPLAGYLALAERLAGPDGTEVAEGWNFGPADEDCRPVAHVIDRLAAAWGDRASWRLSPGPHPHEASFLKVDSAKARARLGWDRRLRLEEALAWTAAWYRAVTEGQGAAWVTQDQIARYMALDEATTPGAATRGPTGDNT